MQEKERVANEEAEKRLKARLSAKRDPSASASRMESPSGANTPRDNFEQKPPLVENEDNAMEVELEITTPAAEVRPPYGIDMFVTVTIATLQSPWIPELEALFEDVRKIAKSSAIDVIG